MTNAQAITTHFMGGEFITHTGATLDVVNPATGNIIASAPNASAAVVDHALTHARNAQTAWQQLPAIARAGYLRTISQALRDNTAQLANIISLEQGKVEALAQMEVFLAAEYLDYMAEWARRIEGEIISSDRPNENIYIYRRPLGVVAAILPWNFPLFMIARKLAPALITGNTVVMKPSEETPLCAQAFCKIVQESGLPAGVFNLVFGGATTGAALTRSKNIDMISFTGSTAAGATIYAQGAENITKVSLELGGKAPVIVMDDADIELAVAVLKGSKTVNSGQACHCPERVYVHRSIADQFTAKLAAAMSDIIYGDPNGGTAVDMGPLINAGAVAKIDSLVSDARNKGATVVCGGKADDTLPGYYYQPTVISGTNNSMAIMHQEVFGPVLVVNTIDTLDDAIARANDSDFGLSSSIFTQSHANVQQAVRDLKAGETYVNRENFEAIQGFHAGIKKSGIGGADGKHGLYEFMSTQVVYM